MKPTNWRFNPDGKQRERTECKQLRCATSRPKITKVSIDWFRLQLFVTGSLCCRTQHAALHRWISKRRRRAGHVTWKGCRLWGNIIKSYLEASNYIHSYDMRHVRVVDWVDLIENRDESSSYDPFWAFSAPWEHIKPLRAFADGFAASPVIELGPEGWPCGADKLRKSTTEGFLGFSQRYPKIIQDHGRFVRVLRVNEVFLNRSLDLW